MRTIWTIKVREGRYGWIRETITPDGGVTFTNESARTFNRLEAALRDAATQGFIYGDPAHELRYDT